MSSLIYSLFSTFQLISQNQQAFIDLLNSEESAPAAPVGGGPPVGGAPGGGFQIQVTTEEKACIE